MTKCNQSSFSFAPCFRRELIARFDAGPVSSDGGALLLRRAAQKTDLLPRLAAGCPDGRTLDRIEHTVEPLISQQVYAPALGYEDLNDHDTHRFDPLLSLLAQVSKSRAGQRWLAKARSTDWSERCRKQRPRNAATKDLI